MISYKVKQRGIGAVTTYAFPIFLEGLFLFMAVGLISGLMVDNDTSGRYALGAFFSLAAIGLAPTMLLMGLNQSVLLDDAEVRWKTTRPFEFTIFWCPWSMVDSVRVWSDKMPSDPTANIRRISIHRPFTERSRYSSNPTYLNIDDHVPEIRQIMDFINAKIPAKVLWEVR